MAAGVGRLDDEDYPGFTMGQAAELLEVQQAFLRSLDAAGGAHTAAFRWVATVATRGASWSSPPGCGRCSTRG